MREEAGSFYCNSKESSDSFLFALAIGGDWAPAVGMTLLVSFLNVGERLPSSKEQFLLFGGKVEENSSVVEKILSLQVKDLKHLESNVFQIEKETKKVKIKFKITKLPNCMKMLSFPAGEFSNSAANFTKFANVNQSEANDYKKSFGIPSQHSWGRFPYSKRVNEQVNYPPLLPKNN